MPRSWQSSVILVVVFGLGLAAGIAGMVWAWPGLHARINSLHPRETRIQRMQRALKLTPAQVSQVQAVFKDTGEKLHTVHLTFQPDYMRICGEFDQVSEQERDAVAPLRRQELDKLQTILTPSQWQAFQQQRAANRRPPRPDLCRRLPPAAGAKPAPPTAPPRH